MSTPELETLLRQYVAAWSEPDPAERRRLLAAVWDEDGRYTDPLSEAAGRAELDGLIAGFLRRNPGAHFALSAPPDHHHGFVRFYWTLRFANGRELAGMDYGEVSADGKLSRIVGFF
jgi:hypothetical protein